MNNDEASAVLSAELAKYRLWSYDRLVAMVDAPKEVLRVVGDSGAAYQIDIYACWDGAPNGDVRVIGCIDSGGWRAYVPLGQSFLKGPDTPCATIEPRRPAR